jgi:hypothetical protein
LPVVAEAEALPVVFRPVTVLPLPAALFAPVLFLGVKLFFKERFLAAAPLRVEVLPEAVCRVEALAVAALLPAFLVAGLRVLLFPVPAFLAFAPAGLFFAATLLVRPLLARALFSFPEPVTFLFAVLLAFFTELFLPAAFLPLPARADFAPVELLFLSILSALPTSNHRSNHSISVFLFI